MAPQVLLAPKVEGLTHAIVSVDNQRYLVSRYPSGTYAKYGGFSRGNIFQVKKTGHFADLVKVKKADETVLFVKKHKHDYTLATYALCTIVPENIQSSILDKANKKNKDSAIKNVTSEKDKGLGAESIIK